MTTHLSEDELILHYYGEIDRADESRIESHLGECAECQRADQQLRQVMTLVDTAAPVEAPLGFERTAWARLEPALGHRRHRWHRSADGGDGLVRSSATGRSWTREGGWFPHWALAGGVAALVFAAFVAGRFSGAPTTRFSAWWDGSGGGTAGVTPSAGARSADADSPVSAAPGRVLRAAVGDHLDRTQMMLVELANADADHADVLAGEQERAADLVAVNRLIRQSVEQSGDAAIADVLEDLERLLLEIANAPANATSNELTDLQSRITTEDLLFRVRVTAAEMRQRTLNDREAGDRIPQKMPIS